MEAFQEQNWKESCRNWRPHRPADPGPEQIRTGCWSGSRCLRAGRPPEGKPEVILIATGSEVCLAVEAHEELLAEGIRSRVVSMPSWEIFDHQTKEYRESVLPPDVMARVAVEQASTFGWERYVGCSGHIIGMKTFGASAPLKELQQKFGFEPERLVAAAKEQLGRK